MVGTTGNVDRPVTSAYCFRLFCAVVLTVRHRASPPWGVEVILLVEILNHNCRHGLLDCVSSSLSQPLNVEYMKLMAAKMTVGLSSAARRDIGRISHNYRTGERTYGLTLGITASSCRMEGT